MKKSVKITACFTTLACLLISGCGDSSKDQSIVFYDCSSSTEKEYGTEDKTADDLVNQLCDYFLDGECEAEEIPGGAFNYKRIDVFQTDGASAGQQKTDENRIIHMELYQYNDEIYCKACFDFSDQEYTAKLPAGISAQVRKLETEGQ
ncbi:hypothetical protein AALA36_16545 [Lachnospiraceae bacterium 66-29]